ncbi:P-loop containing nucleoside triphosphate hydrolase [Pseudocohnilembus persalinus]|uniref:p-loop containing nucleoside triphosphate hydrolase n=1 Tax=Pseudocohnilembus persalinus TaxID=266149 RepID=A0A0V0QC90_PSEPJ|nr:P-loop containing nucleoside triphosphate hydrolase [Pseudocohnilembus persalinus]|eukprot:KRW99794.1 P-loop containing nucleoside triphosphate hydrolase [Pseudocohnilembus persalinus]
MNSVVQDKNYKIIVVGDAKVGKTSILEQYCYNKFDINERVTIGTDVRTKRIQEQNRGSTIVLSFWDIAGQERYQSISKIFIKDTSGCLVVTDITDRKSLENSLKWKEVIEENLNENVPIILVQNKIDLINGKDSHQLEDFQKEENFKQFYQENNFTQGFRISAQYKTNFNTVFDELIKFIKMRQNKNNVLSSTMTQSYQESMISQNSTYQISRNPKRKNQNKGKESKCC